jgi:hypothetical protein
MLGRLGFKKSMVYTAWPNTNNCRNINILIIKTTLFEEIINGNSEFRILDLNVLRCNTNYMHIHANNRLMACNFHVLVLSMLERGFGKISVVLHATIKGQEL